jgi:hypothetical protein
VLIDELTIARAKHVSIVALDLNSPDIFLLQEELGIGKYTNAFTDISTTSK